MNPREILKDKAQFHALVIGADLVASYLVSKGMFSGGDGGQSAIMRAHYIVSEALQHFFLEMDSDKPGVEDESGIEQYRLALLGREQ